MSNSPGKKRRRPSSEELSRWFHRACGRETGALQTLLTLYRPLLMTLARKRLRGATRVKVAPSDLVQTTVWKATQGFESEQFASRGGFLAWLVTILTNEAADVRRRYRDAQKRDVSRERSLFSADTQHWLNQLSASLSASDATRAQRQETIEHLLTTVERLPSHYQLVLRLRYFDKLDFGDIGAKLERTYDAARVLHNRALARLRDELNQDLKDDATTKP